MVIGDVDRGLITTSLAILFNMGNWFGFSETNGDGFGDGFNDMPICVDGRSSVISAQVLTGGKSNRIFLGL